MSTRLLSVVIAALATSVALADIPDCPASDSGAAHCCGCGSIPRRHAALLHGDRRHRRRDSRDRQGRRAAAHARLWIRRRREAHSGLCRTDVVPARFHFEAVHLDRGDAAGRSRQARSRSRHQRVPRFQDRRLRRATDQAAAPDDAHGGLRGIAARSAGRRRQQSEAAGASAEGQHPRADLSAGHRARVFQLRRIARRLHRRACVRHAVRAVHRRTHLQAAEDGALDIPAARAGNAARPPVEQLRHRILGKACAVRVRIGRARRRTVGAGTRHGAIHDGALERRRAAGRRRIESHPETRDRRADAQRGESSWRRASMRWPTASTSSIATACA